MRHAGSMPAKVMRSVHRIAGEAGDEAYIPLANDSRRPRAVGLLRRTNELLGSPLADLETFARGGFYETMKVRPSLEDIKIKKWEGGPALAWARSQAGKPYGWGGVGPSSYDCSGFMSAILNVLQGRPPHRRLFATGSIRAGIAGLRGGLGGRFQIGSFRGSPGHMAGTLAGVNVESSGSAGVRVGGGARGARHPMFRQHFHFARGGIRRGGLVEGVDGDLPFHLVPQHQEQAFLPQAVLPYGGSYDKGYGMLPPGLSAVWNGTGRPEPLVNPERVGQPIVNVYVTLDGRELDHRVNVVVDQRERGDKVLARKGVR